MRDRIYLLSIGEFLKESQGAALMDEAMSKVDVVRRERLHASANREQKPLVWELDYCYNWR